MKKVLLTVATGLLLVGCSRNPLAELQSDTATNHSNSVFWHKEMRHKTPMWQAAKKYCSEHQHKPNCDDVIATELDEAFLHGSTNVPAYGSSGHYLHVPNF